MSSLNSRDGDIETTATSESEPETVNSSIKSIITANAKVDYLKYREYLSSDDEDVVASKLATKAKVKIDSKRSYSGANICSFKIVEDWDCNENYVKNFAPEDFHFQSKKHGHLRSAQYNLQEEENCSIPYSHISCLNFNKEGHLLFIANDWISRRSKGSFWSVKDELIMKIPGRLIASESDSKPIADSDQNNSEAEKENICQEWKLDQPYTLFTAEVKNKIAKSTNLYAPISVAKLMPEQRVFYGQEDGTVGISYYKFLEQQTEGEKFKQCKNSKGFGIGYFKSRGIDRSNHILALTALDVGNENSVAITGSLEGLITIWDTNYFSRSYGFVKQKCRNRNTRINDLMFLPESKYCFASASSDGDISFWDVRRRKGVAIDLGKWNELDSPNTLSWIPSAPCLINCGLKTGELVTLDHRQPTKILSSKTLFSSNKNGNNNAIFHVVHHPTERFMAVSTSSCIQVFRGNSPDFFSVESIYSTVRNDFVSSMVFRGDHLYVSDWGGFISIHKVIQ